MNDGIIATRYAQAFLDYVNEGDHPDEIFDQTRLLIQHLARVPAFRLAISDSGSVTVEQKKSLLSAAVHPRKLCPEFEGLITLMSNNGRSEFFRMVLIDFIEAFRWQRKIAMVQVTSAFEDDAWVNEMIGDMIRNVNGFETMVKNKVDSDIIGGFIVETWWWRYDASVKGALDKARLQLTYKHKKNV